MAEIWTKRAGRGNLLTGSNRVETKAFPLENGRRLDSEQPLFDLASSSDEAIRTTVGEAPLQFLVSADLSRFGLGHFGNRSCRA